VASASEGWFRGNPKPFVVAVHIDECDRAVKGDD
jgi:hypothetical protein